jgi:hypothetical protein
MRQQTHEKVCCGRTRTVSDTGAKLQQVAAKVGMAYSSSLGKSAGRFAEQQPTLGVRQKKAQCLVDSVPGVRTPSDKTKS